jgi:hypothetical protein
VGQATQVLVRVTNFGQRVERQVALAVTLPVGVTPVETQIQPAGTFVRNGQEISFQSAIELPPNQRLTYVIPFTSLQAGETTVQAQVVAEGLATPIRSESRIPILAGAQ